jgi:hypothetical protein
MIFEIICPQMQFLHEKNRSATILSQIKVAYAAGQRSDGLKLVKHFDHSSIQKMK